MPDLPVIEFVQPLPGFPDRSQFALVQLDEDGVLCWLSSVDDPSLRFLVASPVAFFPDYAPVLDEAVVTELEITDAAEVLLLLVLTAGATLAESTANLLAPLVINLRTCAAAQVILNDPDLAVAAPLGL